MKNRIILIISYLLLFFSLAYAQKGRVTESKSHKPISDVNIFLSKDKGLSISDKDGYFDVSDWILLPSDTIHFSHVGYATKSITYATLQNSKYQVLMEETIENLKNVTVTASKIERKASLETQKLSSMPYRAYSYGCILVNGKIYITGGDESSYHGSLANPTGEEGAKASNKPNKWIGFLPKMQIYDIQTDSWSVAKLKFRERAYHTMAFYEDKLLIMGGVRWSTNRRKQYLDETIEWYDIKHNKLSIDKTNPHQAVSPTSFMYKNNVIIMGGNISEWNNGTKQYTNKVHLFNPKTGLWYELADMPKAKNTQGIRIGHYIYLLGGEQNQPLAEIERYNIKNGQWEHIGEFSTNITYSGITTDGEKVYLYSNGYIYLYDLKNNILKKYNTDNLYADCCSICYFNHKLYIFGGKVGEDFNYEPIREVYSIDLDEFKHTNYTIY